MELSFSSVDVLEWSVAEIIGKEVVDAGLNGGKKLRVKLGIDPTSSNIHLGRSIPVWRLRAFQELGHEIHLIIGDFTGQIGDTSDKESERPMLSEEAVNENLKTYIDQLWMILNPEKKDQVHFHLNSEWLAKLSFAEVARLADAFSVNTFIKRELVAKRLDSGSRVSLREMLYPLMQGYDSLAVEADVELGGTDQRFNLLAGRTLQEQAGLPAQAIIMNPLIAGTDGRKMSSSWGNVITLLDTPTDKFGKIMRVEDGLMGEYLAFLPFSARPFTPEELGVRMQSGENPRDIKLDLAQALVALYHGDAAGSTARADFLNVFSEGETPAEVADFSLASLEGEATVLNVLVASGLAPSRSEARRLIAQAGIKVDGEPVMSEDFPVVEGILIQKGKRGFVRTIA